MSHLQALPDGTELVSDFRIEHVIGAGGFGITYLATEIALDRKVTIKEYFPGDFAARGKDVSALARSENCAPDYQWGLDRFIEEAQTLAKYDHPNIVRVYRYFRANKTGYMVLHFEEGQSLKAWLQSLGRAPRQAEMDRIISPLLDALAVVHASDFLHRDIAPDNIIIRSDGSPVLIDFGAARGDIAQHSRTVSALWLSRATALTSNMARLVGNRGRGPISMRWLRRSIMRSPASGRRMRRRESLRMKSGPRVTPR